jgi:phosphoadenosine phosphosulfate reductase
MSAAEAGADTTAVGANPTAAGAKRAAAGPQRSAGAEPAGGDLAAEAVAAGRALEGESAYEVVAWAAQRFGQHRLVLTASFQDCVMIDVAVAVAPGVPVVFLDTGYHFPETLAYVDRVRRRYDLNLTILRPEPGAESWPCGTQRCCELRKVAPLARALAGADAWLTGVRRAEAPTRADAKPVEWDAGRGLVKVNPLVAWSDGDVAAYTAKRNLPIHPLAPQGYASIGCWPTTQPVDAGEDARAGRWADSDKTECGLHL